MVIKRNDVLFGNEPKKRPVKKTVDPQTARAMEVMQSIDSGMTLTRFQIEVATSGPETDVSAGQELALAADALEDAKDGGTTNDIARALAHIALAVDKMDTDLEDVAKEALK